MAKGGKIQHWKHGWIPLTPEARAFAAGLGPNPTAEPARKALEVRQYDDLSPSLQGKINAKLEALTGIPEPELAKKVQANLADAYRRGNPADADWYDREGDGIAKRATGVGLSREQLTGMVSVTSAKKRWVENVNVAEAIGKKLQADEPFDVTPDMISDYNVWAGKRRGGANVTAVPHPELKPGRYRPSELPSDFVASKTPGMPKLLNADGVIHAVKIARGEAQLGDVIGGPKQRSFVNNLMDSSDPRFVTVDTWHYRAAMAGIPIRRKIGPKGHQREYNYTLEQWTDRELSTKDGRAKLYGYDGRRDRYHEKNLAATKLAADSFNPQSFFQAGPSSVADDWPTKNGTYPWFVKQTQIVAKQLGVSPASVQSVAWYAVGGGQ
jgi:hypothetical protein